MPVLPNPQEPRVELKVRLRRSMYERLQEECAHCGCALNSVVTIAISRELARRNADRKIVADVRVLQGQIDIEGEVHAG